jgi:ferredoxin-type protein NapH
MILVHRDPVGIATNWFGSLLLRSQRWVIQLVSLVITNAYFFPGLKRIPCVTLNCYSCPAAIFACPIGVLQNTAISRMLPLYTLGILGLMGSLFGRLSCGWFCPFGFLQDLLHKIKVPKWRLSNRWGWTRYAVLVVLVGLIPYLTLETWFSKLCPAGTLEAGIPLVLMDASLREQIGGMFFIKIAILVVFIAWMLFTTRPFCRFACPLGAILALFNRFSSFRIKVDAAKCTNCGECQKVCPTDIKIYEDVKSAQCVRCLECVKACPESAIKV